MKTPKPLMKTLAVFLGLLLLLPQIAAAQGADEAKSFKPEELEQIVAPIALYPDSLLSQILMASTYPLEVVQATRWAKQNEKLKGDALAAELEKQDWDPSVKSLVNFPEVLQMMNEKLDWTAKLGDAFLAQEKDVMGAVQKLRKKADTQGNLKSTQEQTVIVEKETQTIIIEPAKPEVVYVPTYNPTVVYGAWPYPACPPYYYYPPGYVAGAGLFAFGAGVALGAAWGHAWGNCNWGGGSVNVNVNQNANFNRNIDRSKYQNKVTSGQGGQGKWQHNPEHRKGVSYRDQGTAQRFDKAGSREARSRDDYRGRGDAGRGDAGRGDAGRGDAGRGDAGRGDAGRGDGGRGDRSPGGGRQDSGRGDAGSPGGRQDLGRGDGGSQRGGGSAQTRDMGSMDRSGSRQGSDKSAFSGADRGSSTRDASSRGRESMSSSRGSGGGSSSMSRGSGGGSGSRSSGGSGGSRSGGGGGGSRGGGGRR
jgi:hypothetical protein